MAKKTLKLRAWTTSDVRMLKSLAREKTKTTVIARKLKRTVGATYQQARVASVEDRSHLLSSRLTARTRVME
jgi:hypothetical protein